MSFKKGLSLAFVAGFKRATDEGLLPEIVQYSPYYLPLNVFAASKGSNLYIFFNIVTRLSRKIYRILRNGFL